MNNTGPVFDHIGLWCTDLPESARRFEECVGVAVQAGGRHDGQGTWNRLVGAGSGQYLELIGLDPHQTARGTIARQAADFPDLTPCLLAYRSDNLASIAEAALSVGCETPGPFTMQRANGSGEILKWQVLFLTHSGHPLLPFFIDWQRTPHPSQGLGEGVHISDLALTSPEPESLSKLLGQLGLEIATRHGHAAAIHAKIAGPENALLL